MAGAKDKRLRGRLARGTLLSLLLHANLFVPFLVMVWRWAGQEERERAESVDVSFDSAPDQELPPMPPEAEAPAPKAEEIPPVKPEELVKPPKEKAPKVAEKQPAKKEPKKEKKEDKREAKKEPEPEKKLAEKPPEKEVQVPPLPPMPPPPPPPPAPPPPKAHEKVVDLDNDKNVEPPPDAKFLAQKNNRAEVETRAQETNLDREEKKAEEGPSASRVDPKATDQKDVGDEKAKIAQLEEKKGAFGHEVPKATSPRDREEQADDEVEPARRSVLAIREALPRLHTVSPETADPSLPHDPAGMRAAPRGGEDDHDHDHARMPKGQRLKLALSGRDYEYLFGAQADTERREAQKARSARAGKQAARLARIRSSLENFIPEVKPGNQTALNTRAAPFAAFIAAMHRSIHALWGFGILEDWDELGASSPLNNENLMTNLELVLNGDGSVDKVTVVQGSKYLPFDVAAIDVAYSAGPYPLPPREIRSGNGKIYIHWRFYRDGRQCATSGVDYFILDNRGKDDDRPGSADAERDAKPAASMLHRLSRSAAPIEESAGEEPGAAPARERGGTAASPSETSAARGASDEEAAKRQAVAWWALFARGDVGGVAARSVVPFRAGETVTAKSSQELVPMLRNLLEETPARGAQGFDVLTGASLRKLMGRLPPGFDDGSGRLFVLVRTGGDAFILRLAPVTSGDWAVDGLLRR